jgi:hypothetical protein
MCCIIKVLSLIGLGLALVFASPNYAQAAGAKISSAHAAAVIRKCSVLGFKSAKEYNSSSQPWYTYSTCMVEHGLTP